MRPGLLSRRFCGVQHPGGASGRCSSTTLRRCSQSPPCAARRAPAACTTCWWSKFPPPFFRWRTGFAIPPLLNCLRFFFLLLFFCFFEFLFSPTSAPRPILPRRFRDSTAEPEQPADTTDDSNSNSCSSEACSCICSNDWSIGQVDCEYTGAARGLPPNRLTGPRGAPRHQ